MYGVFSVEILGILVFFIKKSVKGVIFLYFSLAIALESLSLQCEIVSGNPPIQ